MYYFLVFLSSILFSLGIIIFLKRSFFLFCKYSVRQLDIILDSGLNEDRKQTKLVVNLKPLLTQFFVFIFLLALTISIAVLPLYLYLLFTSKEMQSMDLSSFYFFLSLISGSLVLFIPIKRTSDYAYWSKLLHTIFLDNQNISKLLFSLEKKLFMKKRNNENEKFIIVTGLARAGTTALTNLLYETGQFHSLSYANMPLLMAPNLWRKVYNPKKKKLKERAHGDKVLFGQNTIEALDEFFFKVFLKEEEYINESSLEVHQINEVTYKSYLNYQSLIKPIGKKTTYLSKNNNFLLRYKSFTNYNKDFKCLTIFRDPLDHSLSLLNQHNNFCEQQIKDPFILDYMNWLAHHEFGLNQKVFSFNQPNMWKQYEKSNINFWLAVWINYHTYLLSICKDENLILIDYKDLQLNPKKLKITLSAKLGISFPSKDMEPFEKMIRDEKRADVDGHLLNRAKNIYNELVELI